VAWLEFQEGLMWERAGDLAQARRYYESAVARLPSYAAAVGHLAGVEAQTGNPARAIALLEPLVVVSDDPEYAGQLAPLLAAAGRNDDADRVLAHARLSYDDLTTRHREAYADHAARFWLAAGADPKKAYTLASANLALRPTEAAFQLAIDAALAAGVPKDACEIADRALAGPHQGKPLLATVWRAYTACARKKDADAVDARLR
jgi:tetratricopeptide (TPR) repeat protein